MEIFNIKIDRAIQGFFQKIENKIQEFKKLRLEEKQRIKIENCERQEREKREAAPAAGGGMSVESSKYVINKKYVRNSK